MSYEKDVSNIKQKIGKGIALDYDLSKSCGIGLQMRDNELWSVSSARASAIALRTYSLRFYLFQLPPTRSKIFFNPKAGILAGIGTPVVNAFQSRGAAEELGILPHPYFFGVFIEMGAGIKLSSRFMLCAFVKTEASAGMIRNRAMPNENASTSGTFSAGLNAVYILPSKNKK